MGSVTIEELVIPATLGGQAGADFARAVQVGNVVESIGYGTPDIAYKADEELPGYQSPFQPSRLLVARVDGEYVGRATTETLAEDGSDTSCITAQVLPAFRGRGIGRALADAVESLVAADGRSKAIAYIGIQDGPGERLTPPTGSGSVPAGNRDVRFLLERGYSLEQIERLSRMPLPPRDPEARLVEAQSASGPDYVVHTWVGRTPSRFVEDLAVLLTRMSTDAPTAGLEEPEDVWTVERLLAEDDRRERTDPRRIVIAAAEHVPSGRLVAFTELSVPHQSHRAARQYATLVIREHRGHRLGMLVKVANLAHLERVSPGHPSVVTFNAEENRFMLDVNEALGFEPIGYEGAFKKAL